MKIKIEIDLKPEELQRFLGIPDVAGMREEVLLFIKERIAADPAGFLRDNLRQLRKNPAVRRVLYGVRRRRGADDDGSPSPSDDES